MIDISLKPDTLRTAQAQAFIKVAPETIAAIRSGELPKADPLGVAKIAAVQAAKQTSVLIPYCHQVPLDSVDVTLELQDDGIHIKTEVKAIWKTGVEMEALTAASTAALTLYDMLKAIDKTMVITNTELTKKTGGKTSFADRAPPDMRAAIIVTSDGTAAGTRKDNSGRVIKKALQSYGVAEPRYLVLPDEIDGIQKALLQFCEENFHLIITTGGTGLGPRDVTVEATRSIIERELPGMAEAMRSFGQRRTRYAMLSRSLVGLRGRTLIINLPGSSRGAEEGLAALFPALFHAYPITTGAGHEEETSG